MNDRSRSETGLEASIYERFENVPKQAWDRVSERADYCSRGWLEAYQTPESRYGIVWKDQLAVAGFVARVARRPSAPFLWRGHDLWRARFGPIVEDRPDIAADALHPILVVAPEHASPTELLFAADVDRAECRSALRFGLEKAAKTVGAKLVVLPLLRIEDLVDLQAELPDSYPAFYLANYTLPVPESFDEYLKTLPGRLLRDVRRLGRRFEQEGYECRTYDFEEIQRPPWFFSQLSEHFSGEDFSQAQAEESSFVDHLPRGFAKVAMCTRGGTPVATSLTLPLRERYRALSYSIDPAQSEAKNAGVYFEMIYAHLRAAIARRLPLLALGTGGDEAKLRRGARIEPLSFLVWPVGDVPWDLCREHLARHNSQRIKYAAALAVRHAGEDLMQQDLGDALEIYL